MSKAILITPEKNLFYGKIGFSHWKYNKNNKCFRQENDKGKS
jgi:hypothetical protein